MSPVKQQIAELTNPVPEIMPEEAMKVSRIVATGRSDYPNQINDVLCFPGLFKGILECQAKEINNEMLFATVHAIASIVGEKELREDYIIPSVLIWNVPEKVSSSVREAAIQRGVTRLDERYSSFYKA
jgi:malate dehydrogenase (oxaloacetate-decarboxylating)